MANIPDLSLPETAPSVARYRDQPSELLPAALYTLVDLPDDELRELQRICETGCIDTGSSPGDSVRIAPQPHFVGQPLRAVFDSHLQLADLHDNQYDPTYFIVAIEQNWRDRGVLLVALDDDDLECKVDSCRFKAEDSGLNVANLQISNMGWSELKENEPVDRSQSDADDENEGDGAGIYDDDAIDEEGNDSG
ncbi:uncharacterized protein C8Q71DRAFT_209705 [Rhodofomes roseus]|uniref:Uncharacterized protein n=1 Tax=Rhodofomes roseus TaxID=34475 RepID=A0A4Y9YMQ0_9APHY|nr:uncharacterized protein C8Q71DRAFT_209705 [Rhodofomes roseus]KAH9842593.1 hypothetical protein C8Q71DRAFT_209705 [Rhodofomes roseus]TFY63774.1 hypothetical protein EVJ58_g3058 [Rhodofomes roseus]